MQYHLREEAKNLIKKYTSAYLSRLMQREGLRKILWGRFRRIRDKILCNGTISNRILWNLNQFWK